MPRGSQDDYEARSTAKITQDSYLTFRRDSQAKSRGGECTRQGGSKDEIGSRGESSENAGKITTPRKTVYPPQFRMAILGTSTNLRQPSSWTRAVESWRESLSLAQVHSSNGKPTAASGRVGAKLLHIEQPRLTSRQRGCSFSTASVRNVMSHRLLGGLGEEARRRFASVFGGPDVRREVSS